MFFNTNTPMWQNNSFQIVQNIETVKATYVPPGDEVIFMNPSQNCFYIKSVDFTGVQAPIRIFDYKERQAPSQILPSNQSNFVTKDEVVNLVHEILNSERSEINESNVESTDE